MVRAGSANPCELLEDEGEVGDMCCLLTSDVLPAVEEEFIEHFISSHRKSTSCGVADEGLVTTDAGFSEMGIE